LGVPEPDIPVERSGCDRAAVAADGEAPYAVAVASQQSQLTAVCSVPYTYGRIVRGADDPAAIGRHRHSRDPPVVSLEAIRRSGVEVPDDRPTVAHQAGPFARDPATARTKGDWIKDELVSIPSSVEDRSAIRPPSERRDRPRDGPSQHLVSR